MLLTIKITKIFNRILTPFLALAWIFLIGLIGCYILGLEQKVSLIKTTTQLQIQIINSSFLISMSEITVFLILALSLTFVYALFEFMNLYNREKIQRIILRPIADNFGIQSITDKLLKYGSNIYSDFDYGHAMWKYLNQIFKLKLDCLDDSQEILNFLEEQQKKIENNWKTKNIKIYYILTEALTDGFNLSITERKSNFFSSWFKLLVLLYEKKNVAKKENNGIRAEIYTAWISQIWYISWEPDDNESPVAFSWRLKQNFQDAMNEIKTSLDENKLKLLEKEFIRNYKKSWGENVMPNFKQ